MTERRPPPTHRVRVENEMIRRRERQHRYEELWNGRRQYYEDWEKKNSKFDEWTSPRYHETNNKLIEKIKREREHEELLEKRREKLRKLLNDEEQLYRVELMVHKTRTSPYASVTRPDAIPMEVLKELNSGLKVEEDERRRHEAELKLYHQWRSSNPVLKHYERMQKSRDLKLSWLDQQIEARMRKEKEEEECRRILKERDRMMEEELAREEEHRERMEHQRAELRRGLDEQLAELRRKTEMCDALRRKEEEDYAHKAQLDGLERQRAEEEERRRAERECALHNVKQYKMKLKKRAEEVRQSLDMEKELVLKLKELEIADRIEDEMKKKEVKEALQQFLALNQEQKELEKCRQRHLDFLFDSEAKLQYEQQEVLWRQEQLARSKLIQDVLATLRRQMEFNIAKRKEEQSSMIKEREEMVAKIEQYNKEMEDLRAEETRRKMERMRLLNEEVKVKGARKKERENAELRKIDEELERARKEEERLKREIMNIQRRQGPIRPTRSKLFL